MSFLYPLFLAGIAAIGLPILAHMIHSKTRKRVTFSSLMFVPITLPRFRNRSRIEHLLLLILRCAVFCLLALAFSRPFFPQPVGQNRIRPARRIVVLIDTSASMRRAGVWAQAVSEAQSLSEDAGLADRLCVMSFDQDTHTVIGFEHWQELEPAQRVVVTAEQISQLSPSWASTNLGHALVAAAEAIEDDEVNDSQPQALAIHQVVLISDLQQGGNLEALRTYEWPKETELVIKSIRCEGATNAAIQLVVDRGRLGSPADDGRPGVRITNSSDATAERFQLSWAGEASPDVSSQAMNVYVPPHHSTVVRAPARAEKTTAGKLILTGDDHDFDNTLYVAPSWQQQINVLYIGNDEPNDPGEMLYYLRRAFGAAGTLKPRVVSHPPSQRLAAIDTERTHLIIVGEAISGENLVSLRRYLESGRTLLLVAGSAGAVTTMAELTGIDNLESEQADVDQYSMLGRIEFKHPLMAAFSEPRFGDFTRIYFWKYRRINVAGCPHAQVLAWFDNGDPAWLEIPVGKGSLLVWTCGWRPSDSDLALSSKFVPLLYSILEYGVRGDAPDGIRPDFVGLSEQRYHYFVGDAVPVPHQMTPGSASLKIRKPDDSLIALDAKQQSFTQTDLPGIYTVESLQPLSGGDAQTLPPVRNDTTDAINTGRLFAVNLPPKESRTAPMPIEDLEQLGVSLEGSSGVAVERPERTRRQSSLVAMEDQQKIWRWVLIAALVVLLIEIWLAGQLTRTATLSQGEQK
ncbi:MAG: BatA domain-containing protein [Planctomycetota bacterium]|jgi:hypothetical protein